MLGATAIAVFFIPMFFYVLEKMSEGKGGHKKTQESPAAAGKGPTAQAQSTAPGTSSGPLAPGTGGASPRPSARREGE
jgi:multidrug efflux pump